MSITEGEWDLHAHGSRDATRHKEKLQEAFRQRVKDVISQENIITGSNDKVVKIPIKALDNWHFVYDPRKHGHIGQGDGNTDVGDIIGQEPKEGEGDPQEAGGEPGEEYYEAEISVEELIDMMLEDLHLPRLDPKKAADMTATDIRYDDIRKKGQMSNIDKKRSLIENIKRNAAKGNPKVGDFSQDDLRFRTWNERQKPITSAVVIAMMDVSGSMTDDKKYLARSFFFWMVNFLRRKYEEVKVEFISHTTEARVVTEHQFFYQGESGGTACSSAYRLALDVIDERYDLNKWNVFSFHFSDGDTFNDTQECVDLLKRLTEICNMVGYGEITLGSISGLFGYKTLYTTYHEQLNDIDNFVKSQIKSKADVWPTLEKFFSEDIDNDGQ